jgi:hypothetical protein
MRTRNMKSVFFMASLVVMQVINLGANAQEISKIELEQRALNNFNNQRFEKAAADYELLNNMFPKDAKFAYFLGRSYLHSNQYITRSSELLKFVALRNYGEDAYFYLGRAYLLNYEFEDANIAFRTFQSTASTRQAEKCDIAYWMSTCENAKLSVGVAQTLNVESLQVVPSNKLETAFKEHVDGNYIYIPDEFRSAVDKETDYQTLMFIPLSSAIGDYLYFDSKTRKGKQSSDIYRVRRLTAENYSIPELLPEIVNTPYDESFPFFDNSTGTLYFSSKGHNTSGGYDIFKTSFDPVSASWRKPEKLNFPINTPFDDYLYTITSNHEGAIFLTNRNSKPKEVEAYTLKNLSKDEFTSPFTYDEIMACALLTPSAITISESDPAQVLASAETIPEPAPAFTGYKSYSPPVEYAKLISEGMDLQSKSDSLSWSAKEMRLRADKETDYLKKKELIANLTTVDQESKRMQRLAEEKFLLAEQVRGPAGNEIALNSKSEPAVDIKKNELKQVTYNSDQPDRTSKKDASEGYQKGMEAAKNASADVAANFSIFSKSPYSSENPIPAAVIPAGLIYRIQLGAFSNSIPENAFGGLAPVSKEKNATDTKFFVGNFSSIVKAREALEQVKKYGYPDAFIVSYFDSKRIPIQKAREIEFAEK